jgi:hypothetical protein
MVVNIEGEKEIMFGNKADRKLFETKKDEVSERLRIITS